MDELKGTYIITNSLEDFIKAKLIAESYFTSVIDQRKSNYVSRIIHITPYGVVRAEVMKDLYLFEDIRKEILFKDFILNY